MEERGSTPGPAEVSAEAEIVVTRATYCKGTIRAGRFAGRRCGNAVPCVEHDIRPLALGMQAVGPDEYPLGFYMHMARERFVPKRPRPGSVLW